MNATAPTLRHLLRQGQALLAAGDSARLDAELLLARSCRVDRVALYRDGDAPAEPAMAARFQRLVQARRQGVPIAYLTGQKEFWSLDLWVSAAVLVPRPETELLVGQALELLPVDRAVTVLDLGTGSGAVAIALARERPHARVDAVERSPGALRVAARNVARHAPGRVRLLRGDWFAAALHDRYDLIVSNPPYLRSTDPAISRGPTRFEPRLALDGGADGLDAIRHIVAHAPARLHEGGTLLLEHGADQSAAVRGCLLGQGFTDLGTVADLQGHDRVTFGTWRGRG